MRARCALLAVALVIPACGGVAPAGDNDGEWVGEVSTEGDVTVVRNVAGSKWGGPATLVEEASIGVDVGPPEYMLGSPFDLFATEDEIYVIDTQVPILRVYDWSGTFLREIGGVGQGPGEYERPSAVLVGRDGRVYVSEGGSNSRINVYSRSGEPLETWRWTDSTTRISSGTLIMQRNGALFTRAYLYENFPPTSPEDRISGMQQVGPDGGVGDLIEMPDLGVERMQIQSDRITYSVPYSPGQVSAFAPAGAWIVGNNSEYSFEIHYPDKRVVKVERYWSPVEISAEEKAYSARTTTYNVRRFNNDPEWSYNGSDIPDHKPAYYLFIPTQGERVMVVRYGDSHLVDGCDLAFDLAEGPGDEPCFEFDRVWDMFDLEGNYLGEVPRPSYPHLYAPFFRDDTVLMAVENEEGVMQVKRFRFDVPGAGTR